MFHYLFKSKGSQTIGVTVSPDVITLFSQLPPGIPGELPSSLWLSLLVEYLRQCSSDKRYLLLHQYTLEHLLRPLHINDTQVPMLLTQENEHFHFVHDGIVTPTKFSCLLEQIQKYQEEYLTGNLPHFDDVFVLARNPRNGKMTLFKPDLETPFLPASEVSNATKAYETFYLENVKEIQEDYQQEQQAFFDISRVSKFSMLANTAWQSGKQGFMFGLCFDVLHKVLRKAGVKEIYSHWFACAINLALVVSSGATWYRIIPLVAVFVLSNTISKIRGKKAGYLMTNLAMGIIVMASSQQFRSFPPILESVVIPELFLRNFEYTAFAVSNFVLAAFTGLLGGAIGKNFITVGLFAYNRVKTEVTNQADFATTLVAHP